jgi:hypothetical protein
MRITYGAVAMIAGLVLMLSACEKEVVGVGSEGKVALAISVSNAEYVAEEGALKHFNTKTQETVLERVVVPLGEDEDYYLSATLRPSPEQSQGEELRGTPSNGQLITLAAFKTSNDVLMGSANYYYSTSVNDLMPQTPGSLLMVDVNDDYYIVAYSYNSTTENPGTSNIDPSKDLLWGKSASKYITLSDRTVTINMAHLFSKVKVNISTANVGSSATITAIGTVRIEGRKLAGLDLTSGNVTPGSALGAMEVGVTGAGATKTSDEYLFYPSPTRVTISSITISGAPNPFNNLAANFTKVLEAGKSYILDVDLARVNWAYSNIYWDGSKLTFDKRPTNSHPNYQGVFFKRGSLVGISPGGSTSPVADQSGNVVYVPPVRGESAWATSTMGAANAWGSDYSSIPRVNTPSELYNDYTTNYLYDQVNNPASHHYNYCGDICSYLTGGAWRMPNGAEFGVGTNYSTGNNGSHPNDATGRGSMNGVGYTYNSTVGQVFFPSSGVRSYAGWLDYTYVAYWSGSGGDMNSSAYALCKSSGLVTPIDGNAGTMPTTWALPVRCMKN